MATESSPPQIRIILTVAFSSVVILAALNAVFRSYFLMMTEEVEHNHLSRPEELLKLREGEQRNLTTSAVPISEAMHEIATRGRTNYAAFMAQADITPLPSTDFGPMVGWVRAPNEAAMDAMNAATDTADAGAAASATGPDGGAAAVTTTTDADAAPKAAAPDAGGHSK